MQAVKYSFITHVWSKVDVLFCYSVYITWSQSVTNCYIIVDEFALKFMWMIRSETVSRWASTIR